MHYFALLTLLKNTSTKIETKKAAINNFNMFFFRDMLSRLECFLLFLVENGLYDPFRFACY